MEFNSSAGYMEPWGIVPYDSSYIGLPKLVFNLLRVCNKKVGISALGHFLKTGIESGQRVALVSFEHPTYLLASFKEYGFSFDDELLTEQLIYLYYKPFFSHSLNFATNHRHLIDEIKRLSKGDINRIAFMNADVLFNLETRLLSESSAERIMASFSEDQCVVLGCYQATDAPSHQNLDEASKSFLSSYIEIKSHSNSNDQLYELVVHKSPLPHMEETIGLYLMSGLGFNSPKIDLIKHG